MSETLNSQIDLVLGNVPEITDELEPDEVYQALLKVHAAIEILVDFYDASAGLYVTLVDDQTIAGIKTFSDTADINNGTLGDSAASLVSFWGASTITQPASALQAALTNNTGGAYDGTLSPIVGSNDDANINNNFTELHTLLNEIRTALVASGIIKGAV